MSLDAVSITLNNNDRRSYLKKHRKYDFYHHYDLFLYIKLAFVFFICWKFELETVLHPPGLLLVHLDNVILLHLQCLGGFVIIDPASVEEKTANINKLDKCIGFIYVQTRRNKHIKSENYTNMIQCLNIFNLPEGGDGDSNSLSVRLFQFSHLSCLLYTEVDLVAVLAHDLQLDVLSIVSSHDGGLSKCRVGPLKMAAC